MNALILIGVSAFILYGHQSGDASALQSNFASKNNPVAGPVDELSSADIAANVASMVAMPEAEAVENQADSANIQLAIAQVSNSLVTKPQVVATDFLSNKDIKTYTVKGGDTLASIAKKFHVTAGTVRASNDLLGNVVSLGQKLYIPPVDGIVYVVEAGDTPASLAKKYNASEAKIIAFNDAEIKGITVGERIVIPGGTVSAPVASTPSYYSYFTGATGTYNLYQKWNCTWWVAYRWAQSGYPVLPLLGNANEWYARAQSSAAQRAGMSVGRVPKAGAAAVTTFAGFGHVVYVESVDPVTGSVNISEMNLSGANTWYPTDPTVTHRTVSASEAAGWYYIYP